MPVPSDGEEDDVLVPPVTGPVSAEEFPEAPLEVAPSEPQSVTATIPGPPLSSDVPATDQEPLPAADGQQQDEEPLPEFDPRWKNDFEGLLYLGKLKKMFNYVGHKFVIRTMTVGEVIEIGLLTRDYVNTLGEIKAYQSAVCAACVVTVDGQAPPIPITDERADTVLLNRFTYINAHWFPPIIDKIYEEYLLLEDRVRQVLEEMGKPVG